MNQIKAFTLIITFFILIMLYQNCGGKFESISTSTESSTQSLPEDKKNTDPKTVTDLQPPVTTPQAGQTDPSDLATDINQTQLEILVVKELSRDSSAITIKLSNPSQVYIEYGTTDNYGNKTLLEEKYLLTHVQRLNELVPGVIYNYRVHFTDKKGNEFISKNFTFKKPEESGLAPSLGADNENNNSMPAPVTNGGSNNTSPTLSGRKFCKTQVQNLNSNCFKDPAEFVADFLFKNPTVCFWKADKDNSCVEALETPRPPSNAVQLPKSNGSNDTTAIQALLAKGGLFVGDGSVYRLSNLKISKTVRIWNMPSVPANGAKNIGTITAPDVHIYNSLIDGKNQSGFNAGWIVGDGAHRFTLVNSGVINIYNTKDSSTVYGLSVAEADDVHITCNRFENLIGKTAAVRGIWINPGSSGSKIIRGGTFANNVGGNFQSKNSASDADTIVLQGHPLKEVQDRPFLFMANRFVDGGKRLIKMQTGNTKTFSNYYHWKSSNGPLGSRTLSEAISSFTSNNIARNNHIKFSATGRVPKTMFSMLSGSIISQGENNHFNCNLVEYDVDASTSATSAVFTGVHVDKVSGGYPESKLKTGREYKNSSFTHNIITGKGRPLYDLNFRGGWNTKGQNFKHSPNTWETTGQKGIYRPK